MHSRRLPLALLGFVLLAANSALALNFTNASTNNTAVGTVTSQSHTWDPGESLAITGTLWQTGNASCETNTVYANLDSIIVIISSPESPGTTGAGQRLCGALPLRYAASPGTNSSGNFSFSIRGGGVSFQAGDGYSSYGSIIEFVFKEGNSQVAEVWGGTYTRWPEVTKFVCDEGYAPDLYGHLASPDLNGDTYVDAGDVAAYGTYAGYPVTKVSGWQADFNHQGATVDGSDVAYFAARLGVDCNSSKVGDDYVADVANLQLEEIRGLMSRAGITDSDILAKWDEWGWSYNRNMATRILGASIANRDWSSVKQMFR